MMDIRLNNGMHADGNSTALHYQPSHYTMQISLTAGFVGYTGSR